MAEHTLVDAQLETLYVACLLSHLHWTQKRPQVTNGAKAALMMRIGKELVQHFLPTALPTGVDWDDFYTAVTQIPRIEQEMGDAIRELSPAVLGGDGGSSEGLKRASDSSNALRKRQAKSTEAHTHAPVPTGVILADMSTVQRLIAVAITDAETPGVLIPILTVFAVFFARWYARWKRNEDQTYYEALMADGDLHKDVVLLLTTCLLVWAVLAGQADYSALGPVEGNPLLVALTKDANILMGLDSRNDAYVREMFRAQQVAETLLEMPLYQAARQSLIERAADLATSSTDYSTEGILEALSKKYAGDTALMGTATWNEAEGVANVPGVRPFLNVFINQPLPRDQYEVAVRAANLELIRSVRGDPRSYASMHKCAIVLRILSLLIAMLFGAPALQEIREGRADEDHEDAAFDMLSVVEHVFARGGGRRLR